MTSRAAIKVDTPMFTSTAHPIIVENYSDANHKTPADLSAYTVRVVVENPTGTTFSYSASDITASGTPAATYRARATLTANQHTTAGAIKIQVTYDGIPKEHYTSYLNAKL